MARPTSNSAERVPLAPPVRFETAARAPALAKPVAHDVGAGAPALAEPVAHERRRTFIGALVLAAVVVAIYAPALVAGFIWDDDVYVTANATLRSADGLRRIWLEPRALPQYYPLVHSTFWAEYHLWGLAPAGFHVTNVLLHATSVILAWRLLVRLRVPGAWLAAAIFAVHPVQVESVAWIAERKNVLSLVFALLSMLCYLRFAPLESGEEVSRPRSTALGVGWYLLAFALFAAALLAKTVSRAAAGGSPSSHLVETRSDWQIGRHAAATIFRCFVGRRLADDLARAA